MYFLCWGVVKHSFIVTDFQTQQAMFISCWGVVKHSFIVTDFHTQHAMYVLCWGVIKHSFIVTDFRKNINCTIAESLERFEEVTRAAREVNIPVRG